MTASRFLLRFILLSATSCAPLRSEYSKTDILKIIDDETLRASSERFAAKLRADFEYRRAIASTFRFTDRIEISLLEQKGAALGEDEEGFPIRPYDTHVRILKTRSVDPKWIPDWLSVITAAITSDKETGTVMCHIPEYGLRLYAGKQLLFETSICWTCFNYYFEYDRVAQWESFSIDGANLKEALEEFLPRVHSRPAAAPEK